MNYESLVLLVVLPVCDWARHSYWLTALPLHFLEEGWSVLHLPALDVAFALERMLMAAAIARIGDWPPAPLNLLVAASTVPMVVFPDSAAAVYTSYFAWAPAFVAMIRARLGPAGVILANSAGAISDSSLSGITIEMEEQPTHDALDAQHAATAAAGLSPVSVVWLTHSESVPAAKQCQIVAELQQQRPWIQAGTDFFDGSHVVC